MKILLIIIVLIFAAVNSALSATVIPVYFVWGQSNATDFLRQGVENSVTASNPNSLVVVSAHPGDALHFWYRNAPYQNLIEDIAILSQLKTDIESEGNIFQLAALIGMQGESDRYRTYEYWYSSMVGIAETYQQVFGVEFGKNSALILGQSAVNEDYNTEAAQASREGLLNNINPAQIAAAALFGGPAVETGFLPRADFWHLTRPAAVSLGEVMGIAALTHIPEPSTLILGLLSLLSISLLRKR